MKQVDENEVVHKSVLEQAGFRKHGMTLFRILHHEEIRYIQVRRDMYAFEGRFPIRHEMNRREVEDAN